MTEERTNDQPTDPKTPIYFIYSKRPYDYITLLTVRMTVRMTVNSVNTIDEL